MKPKKADAVASVFTKKLTQYTDYILPKHTTK